MKKAQLKTIFWFMIFCVLSLGIVYAGNSIVSNHPSNEWSLGISTNFNFTPKLNLTVIPWCAIIGNHSSDTWTVLANYSDVANGTPFVRGIALNDTRGLTSAWNVTCFDGSFTWNTSSIATYGVDSNPPSIELVAPAAGAYVANFANSLTNITFIPTDSTNPGNCSLYTNFTGNWVVNFSVNPFSSGTTYGINFTHIDDSEYIWNVQCNDTAGNKVWASPGANRSFTLDTTAPKDINFTSPANNTFSSNSTPEIIWNQTVDVNFDKYVISLSSNFNMSEPTQALEITTITENSTVLRNIENDGTYFIQVIAFDLAGHETNSTFVLRYILDSTDPSLNLTSPANASYISDGSPDFNITIIDDSADTCVFWISNSTRGLLAINNTISVNSSFAYNFTPTIQDGNYTFNIGCNDSVGAFVNISNTPLELIVDTTSPTISNITSLWHGVNNTDLTPFLTWQTTFDLNFAYYIASAVYISNGTIADTNNVTIATTTFDLNALGTYNFSVTTVDLARNFVKSINSSTQTSYYIDDVCGLLYSGWNLCGVVWTGLKNLSRIGAETNADMVSVWNRSSHTWATCNYQASASGTNCQVNTAINDSQFEEHVWVNVNSSNDETNWQNRTWVATQGHSNRTLSNISGSNGWNILGMNKRNGADFRTLGLSFNQSNVTMFSMPYNINGTSAPYVNKGLFATSANYNATILEYGAAMWVFYNASGSQEWNWTGVD